MRALDEITLPPRRQSVARKRRWVGTLTHQEAIVLAICEAAIVALCVALWGVR